MTLTFYSFKISESKFQQFVTAVKALDIEILSSYLVDEFFDKDVKGILCLNSESKIPVQMQQEKLLEQYGKNVKRI